MDLLVIALIVVASVVGYAFGAGASFVMAIRRLPGDDIGASLVALIWPIALPVMLGVSTGHWLAQPKRAALPEARTRKDLP